jgi:2-desacetyl-2-hydroxyethyl bacteriochlorophyllide A dehydrogenase
MNAKYPMAFVAEPGKIEFQERELPALGDSDVRLKVKVVTICGSDLHIFKGKHPAVALPVPVGHELAGVVEATGPRVRSLKIGDRVAVEPVIACGECYFCQRGQYHLCTNISFQYRRGQGALTPYFIAAEKWVHKLPPKISFTEGAMLEPLSVAVHAVKKSRPELASTSAIFGAGAIGLLLLQVIRQYGGGDIFVIDVNDYRLETARQLGATYGFHNRNMDALQAIFEHTAGLGVDRAYEAVGLKLTLIQALKALKKGGLAILLGLFEQSEINIPANLFVQKEISLAGSQGYCWDFQTAIQLVAHGQIDLKRLVTHEFHFSDVQQAFDTLLASDSRAIKVAIRVDE